MAYRDGARCTFCDEPGVATCGRCGDAVCVGHGLSAEKRCWGCEKELRDDLELVRFASAVAVPEQDYAGGNNLWTALRSGIRALRLPFDEARVRRVYLRRTKSEIVAWRRRSGIGRVDPSA